MCRCRTNLWKLESKAAPVGGGFPSWQLYEGGLVVKKNLHIFVASCINCCSVQLTRMPQNGLIHSAKRPPLVLKFGQLTPMIIKSAIKRCPYLQQIEIKKDKKKPEWHEHPACLPQRHAVPTSSTIPGTGLAKTFRHSNKKRRRLVHVAVQKQIVWGLTCTTPTRNFAAWTTSTIFLHWSK